MTLRLRYALSASFFFAYGAFALPFAPVILILPVAWVRWIIRMFYKGFRILARWTGLYRTELAPGTLQALRNCRGRIVAMNHVSLIDICIILSYLPDSTAIAKAGVLRNPALAAVARKMFIVNDESPERIVAECGKLLKRGVNIVVFPQGTRAGAKFHRGAARLALGLGAEILPVRIAYDPVVLDKRHPWYYAGDRTIQIALEALPPLKPEGADDFHHAQALTKKLISLLQFEPKYDIIFPDKPKTKEGGRT